MADQFTETTNQGWFSRLGDSFKGIVFGFVLFLLGFPLLFWNEGRAVQTFKSLTEGAQSVISVPVDAVDKTNEGKLIYTSGITNTSDSLTDLLFGVTTKAIKLIRHVEMYQWKEESHSKTEKKLGGGTQTTTTYTYEKEWSETYHDSSRFKQSADHTNPAPPTKSEEFLAKNVTLGDFKLSPSQIKNISGGEELRVTADQISTDAKTMFSNLKVEQGALYLGANSAAPQVGDVKITYQQILPSTISVIARQIGHTFEPYITHAGGKIDLLAMGEQSATNMFETAQTANKYMTWGLRALGFFMMFFGIGAIFKPLSVLGDVIPFIGSIIGFGTNVIAFFIASVFALITIAFAWLASRPLLGISLLVISAGILIGFLTSAKKKSAALVNKATTV